MDAMFWLFLPLFVAAGSALLAYFVMQSKLEVVLAKERETTAEARAAIANHARNLEDTIRATEERVRRQAFDDFLADFRVEERHYTRESKSLFLNRKSMVLQERLFFRNIPLSNWVEHEMVVEDGGDIQKLAKACSVFGGRTVSGDVAPGMAQLGGNKAVPVSSGNSSSKLIEMDAPQPRRKGIAG